jgi:hypothetical protein
MQPSGAPKERICHPASLNASDEEVVLHVRGFAVLRAIYEAEGYYDEAADGDPEEQDLFLIELLDAPRASRAAEALDGRAVWPLADLGLCAATVRRLFPAARWTAEAAGPPLVAQYLLMLAWALQEEARPETRYRLLQASATWSPAAITDAFQSLPARWREVEPAG